MTNKELQALVKAVQSGDINSDEAVQLLEAVSTKAPRSQSCKISEKGAIHLAGFRGKWGVACYPSDWLILANNIRMVLEFALENQDNPGLSWCAQFSDRTAEDVEKAKLKTLEGIEAFLNEDNS